MAKLAGIELRPDQIKEYILGRQCEDKNFRSLYDQQILCGVLDLNQAISLRRSFPNICF